jgi:TrmH family RNA methyltransferase
MMEYSEFSNNVRVVLVQPTHPGNIGGVARAMKTMCLVSLYLVDPVDYLGQEARARAGGAQDVLLSARRCASLEQALAGCRLVIATSARTRSIPWPMLEPGTGAERLIAEACHGPVALVFGREKTGLSNAELDLCQYMVGIPSNSDYPSLNLACAVQVMSYELMRARQRGSPVEAGHWREAGVPLAQREDIERFYRHLEEVLTESGFLDPAKPGRLMRRLYRLFNRACLDENEVNVLRGILTAVQQRWEK